MKYRLLEEELYPSSEETYQRLIREFSGLAENFRGYAFAKRNFEELNDIEQAEHNFERFCVYSFLLDTIKNSKSFEDFLKNVKAKTSKNRKMREEMVSTINYVLEDWSDRFIDQKFNFVY